MADEKQMPDPEGRAVINVSEMRKKIAALVVVVATLVTGLYIFFKPTGYKGVYGNKVSSYITTDSGRTQEVAWLVKNGFNSYCGYGISDYLSSHPEYLKDFNLKLRRAGVSEIGLIYSSSSFIAKLDVYQKSCKNDSMKFSFVVSEIEQYSKTGNRPEFYKTLRTVSSWCLTNKVKRYSYQGHPNLTDVDSIVYYTDRVFQHAYRQYDKYGSKAGDDCYGYTKSKLEAYASAYRKFNPASKDKYNVVIIYSSENPDQSLTQFGYKYFLTHSWQSIHSSFTSYYNLNATHKMKDNLTIGGSQMFVENQMKKIKP